MAAEGTVEILKRKVLQMYEGGPQTSLHRSLERAQAREERNNHRRELAELRAEELRRHSDQLEVEVARRTEAIQRILDNVTFGFLLVDGEGRILEGITRSCADLLGRQPRIGELFVEALGVPDSTFAQQWQLGVDQVFEDFMPEEVTLDQLPRRVEMGKSVLNIEARVIRDPGGLVSSVLLTISDITALENAQRESKQRDVLIGILRQKASFELFVAETRSSLSLDRGAALDQHHLRRVVHTIKGNAASWGLEEVVAATHLVEDQVAIKVEDLESVGDALRRFLEAHEALLEIDFEVDDPGYAVAAEDLRLLVEFASDPHGIKKIEDWVSGIVCRPARELLGPVGTFAERLAERLGKEVDFCLRGGDVLMDSEVMRPVLRNLSHLIRNSIDHGIECSGERGDKPARGRVDVRLAEHEDHWSVEVIDDGRGVQGEVLAARAVETGLLTAQEAAAMSPLERVCLMFREGISSSRKATEVSGRGVGMPAVHEAVRQQSGSIEVETGKNGTRILLEVPKPGSLRATREGSTTATVRA